MARRLDVYLLNSLVGHLAQDDRGEVSFQYARTRLGEVGSHEAAGIHHRSHIVHHSMR
jgi:hypothetical protein